MKRLLEEKIGEAKEKRIILYISVVATTQKSLKSIIRYSFTEIFARGYNLSERVH